jgi:hypothetical protein
MLDFRCVGTLKVMLTNKRKKECGFQLNVDKICIVRNILHVSAYKPIISYPF